MNIYAATESRLSGDSSITALVSTRIYPGFANLDAALPQICITSIGGDSVMSMTGSSGLGTVTLQITCWGATYNAAITLLDLVRLRLQGTFQTVGSVTDYRCVSVSAPRDVFDASAGNEALKRYGVSRDFTIHHSEPTPS